MLPRCCGRQTSKGHQISKSCANDLTSSQSVNFSSGKQHEELKSAQRDTNLRAGSSKAAKKLKRDQPQSCSKVTGNGKVILDTHPESDQHQNQTSSTGSPPAPTHQIWW